MRRFYAPIVWAAALTAPCAHAEEFSWQITGGGRESDVGHNVDAETATVAADYFFQPVDDANGPYALAPFLNRASRIGASYSEDKATSITPVISIGFIQLPPSPPVTVVTRAEGYALSGQYVWRSTGWYVGAAVAETEAAHPAPLPTSFSLLGDDLSTRSLALGKYVGPATTVELSLEAAETTLTSELPLFCIGGLCSIAPLARLTTTLETEVENVGVSALHVGRLGRMQYSLSGGVTSSQAEGTLEIVQTLLLPLPPLLPALIPSRPVAGFMPVPGTTSASSERRERYALAGELFPTQALGIRVGYARWDGDEALDESYELGVTWFFTRNIGAQVAVTRTKSGFAIATVTDVDTVALQLVGRL